MTEIEYLNSVKKTIGYISMKDYWDEDRFENELRKKNIMFTKKVVQEKPKVEIYSYSENSKTMNAVKVIYSETDEAHNWAWLEVSYIFSRDIRKDWKKMLKLAEDIEEAELYVRAKEIYMNDCAVAEEVPDVVWYDQTIRKITNIIREEMKYNEEESQ